jgi:hypothetical protein
MAAAIAAKPDIPVPMAATPVHADPPPELAATAYTVTVGVAGTGLLTGSAAGANPTEGDGEAAIAAERSDESAERTDESAAESALGPAVTVTVTVTGGGLRSVPALTAPDVAVTGRTRCT